MKRLKINIGLSIFTLILILTCSTCKKEVEVLKEIERVNDSSGLTIKPDQAFEILEDAVIKESILTDTIQYEDQRIPRYEMVIEGYNLDDIENGTIIVDKENKGTFYMVYEISSTKSTGNTQFINIKAFRPSLDFLFNYKGAIVEFCSKENRAKKESSISGRLYSNQIEEDKFEIEETGKKENWNGYSSNKSAEGLNLNFSKTKFGIKGKKESSQTTTEASLNCEMEGFIHVNPGIDFLMEYNPKYTKTNDNELVSFIQATTNLHPTNLFVNSVLTLGTLKQLRAILYTELDYGLNIELSIDSKISDSLFEKKLYSSTHTFMAGPVPISTKNELKFKVDVSTEGELSASYYFNEENNIVLGYDLQKNSITDKDITWYREVNSRSNGGGSLVAEIELSAGVKLVWKTEVYVGGVIGPSIAAEAYAEGEIDFWTSTATNSPGWGISLDAGLEGKATFDLSLFHFDKTTWSLYVSDPIEVIGYNIYSSPYEVQVLNGNNQTGYSGKTLDNFITFEVFDKFGYPVSSKLPPVPVFLGDNKVEGFNGTVPKSPVFTEDAKAKTSWTLSENAGEQKLLLTLRDEHGVIFGVSDTVIAMTTEAPLNETGTLTDSRDNKTYKTVKIGDQWWMAENLAYDAGDGCWAYNNDEANVSTYGRLYNWEVAKSACPNDWHLPTDDEWKQLEMAIGMSQSEVDGTEFRGTNEGTKLKATSGWSSNSNGTDNFGFSALPGGARDWDGSGEDWFNGIGLFGYWWSGTERFGFDAWQRSIIYEVTKIDRVNMSKDYGLSVRCIKGDNNSASTPSATTNQPSNIAQSEATLNGDITSDGGSSITQRGFYWSKTDNTPDSNDNVEIVDGTTGNLEKPISGLEPNTTYYYCSFATNSIGTAKGEVVSFTTLEEQVNTTGTFTDSRDGNTYKWVKIGDQTWMAENLAYLPSVSPPDSSSNSEPVYYVYDYLGNNVAEAKSTSNFNKYGVLYNYTAALSACPKGWHLPTSDEWDELSDYLGGGWVSGGKLKSTTGWEEPNTGATNESGFSALPGGARWFDDTFIEKGISGIWHRKERDCAKALRYDNDKIINTCSSAGDLKGLSIRCIKD